jgi:Protein of unknown function (DUF4058)
MPLLDHFHPPLFPFPPWESVHGHWASAIAGFLNQRLPPKYLAVMQMHLGSHVEADVAEVERLRPSVDPPATQRPSPANGAPVGVAVEPWSPPLATLALPMVFPDDFEVQLIDETANYRVIAAVELVSPGNLDRPEKRRAFAAKCATYLQRGIGLVIVDIVTMYRSNLHNDLVHGLGLEPSLAMADDAWIYAVGYRPVRRQEINQVDVWPAPLQIGSTLPLVPLALCGAGILPVDLEATYTNARERSRL